MRCSGIVLLLASASWAAELPTQQVKLNGQTFTLPQGFTLEVAAAAPLTLRPVAVALDDKGRLYVTESSGSNEPAAVQLAKKPHSILRLEDTNQDGIFDKKTTFADALMFPQGIMWKDGSIYVGCPPHIWKLTDTNDDGIADRREVWFDGGTLTGCLNDLHGPYDGPDGYIYWTKGAFAQQSHTLGTGQRFTSRASHIFRMKPDRTGLDVVMTGGMDNPVDVVFTPTGEIIFSTTFFQHPSDGKRDGLIHAIYGGIYGKDHDVIHDPVHRWTRGTTLPVLTHLGPAAPCGLHRYNSKQFGPEYYNNLFCAQFNLRTVSRHILHPHGSTFRTEDQPFLVSDSLDFHPTDVIEAPDGSLLIVDTGGWYKLCCPTSALVKDDVHGAIYRVRKVGAHQRVEARATPPLPPLYTAALNRDPAALPRVKEGLNSDDPATRRLAAQAAGRIGNADALPWLIDALKHPKNDTALDHALVYAIIELNQIAATLKYQDDPHPAVQRAVLLAIGQNRPEQLPHRLLFNALRAPADKELSAAAWLLIRHHPELGKTLFPEYRREFQQLLKDAEQQRLADELARLTTTIEAQAFLGELAKTATTDASRAIVLQAMARSRTTSLPASWVPPVVEALNHSKPTVIQLGLDVLKGRSGKGGYPSEISSLLQRWPDRLDLAAELHLAGLVLLPEQSFRLNDPLFAELLLILGNQESRLRNPCLQLLSRAKWSSQQQLALIELLPKLGPLEVPLILQGLIQNKPDQAMMKPLLARLESAKLRALIQDEQLKKLAELGPDIADELTRLQRLIDMDRATDRTKVETLLKQIHGGDVRRGQTIFYSQKAACSSCHKIGYVGGVVGPDLSRIGSIRSERDLLEAIVLPSASFVRSYEPVQVNLDDGRVFNGILKEERPTEIVLTLNATDTVTLKRSDIESLKPGRVSIMPAGLDQQLTRQELADLLAFLKSRR